MVTKFGRESSFSLRGNRNQIYLKENLLCYFCQLSKKLQRKRGNQKISLKNSCFLQTDKLFRNNVMCVWIEIVMHSINYAYSIVVNTKFNIRNLEARRFLFRWKTRKILSPCSKFDEIKWYYFQVLPTYHSFLLNAACTLV